MSEITPGYSSTTQIWYMVYFSTAFKLKKVLVGFAGRFLPPTRTLFLQFCCNVHTSILTRCVVEHYNLMLRILTWWTCSNTKHLTPIPIDNIPRMKTSRFDKPNQAKSNQNKPGQARTSQDKPRQAKTEQQGTLLRHPLSPMVASSMSPTTGRESQGTDREPFSPTSAAAATAASPPGASSNDSAVLSPVPTPIKSPTRTTPPPPAAIRTTAAPVPYQASSPLSELKVGLNNQELVSTGNPAVVAVAEPAPEGGVGGGAATTPAAGAVGASGQGDESGGDDGTMVDERSLAPPGQGEEAAQAAAAAAGPPRRGRNGVSLQLGKEELLPPTDPPIMPPSACTTPAGSPKANPGGMADTMVSPPASPWPTNSAKVNGDGNGNVSGNVSGGGRAAAAAAAGIRARGENGHDGTGYRGAGDVFCMSPVSAKALSPRVSPRTIMSSPPPGSSAQQRGTSIFAGGGRLEASDWWKVSTAVAGQGWKSKGNRGNDEGGGRGGYSSRIALASLCCLVLLWYGQDASQLHDPKR